VYWWGNIIYDNFLLTTQIIIPGNNSFNTSYLIDMKSFSLRLFLYVKGFMIAELFFVLVSNIFFGFYIFYNARKKSNFISNNLEKFKKLPLKSQITLLFFTISIAIPNKVFVNNYIKPLFLYFLFTFYLFLGFIEPVLWIIFIQYFFIGLFSFVFAYLYETFEWFKIKVDSNFFNNDHFLSKKYFSFFWGNMQSSGRKIVGATVPSLVSIGIPQLFHIVNSYF
jgi:hypothetical protein